MKKANSSMRTSCIISIFVLLIIALPQALAQPASTQAYKAMRPSRVAQDRNTQPGGERAQPGPGLGQATTPLQSMLNPDGTLNLKSGFSGSLDARGWQMASNPDMPPRFVRSDAETGTGSLNSPLIAGDENWDGTFGIPDVSNAVYAVAVSGNGDTYIGGWFTTAGGLPAQHIAKWNRDGWSAVGSGMNNTVYAIAVSGNGTVYAGGQFTTAGGVSANYIAKWNGTSWSALGSGMNDIVHAIAVSSTGTVYAGGQFTTAGGVSAIGIAKWDGTSWSALGGNPFYGVNGTVDTIAVNNTTGDVYAGGNFTTAGGVTVNHIAKWNGTSWSALSTGMNNIVEAIAVNNTTGDVYAGGYFTTAGGVSVNYIAKWNGSAWSALGSGGMDADVRAIAVSGNGTVYAGGLFTTAGGVSANYIAKWNGSAWSALGTGGMDSSVEAIAVNGSGDVYAGGFFTAAGVTSAHYIAKWNGVRWSTLGSGVTLGGYVLSMAINGSTGDVYAGGIFDTAGGVSASRIARWGGSAWSALGSGVSDRVEAIAVNSTTGDVYAGGYFMTAGGVTANHIAKWNGSSWSALDSGMNGMVYAVAVNSTTGDVYGGGYFTTAGGVNAHNIAKWNGSTWSAMGVSPYYGVNDTVEAIAVSGNGDVYAGGSFSTAGGELAYHIAKWNGSAWSPLNGGTTGDVHAIALSGNATVYAGGDFTTADGVSANRIAKWNGSSWSALGSGLNNTVGAVAVSGNGTVYAGGDFTTAGGGSANYIAKWNGSSWSNLGSGVNNYVLSLAVSSTGDVYAGGVFNAAGGKTSLHFGLWHNPTPPTPTPLPTQTPGGPTATPTSCLIQFTDVPLGSTFYTYVRCLACRGIINGYSDNTFRPNNNITRGQLSKILSNSAGYNDTIPPTQQTFSDVPPSDTFWLYIERIYAHGAIQGYAGNGTTINPCTGLVEATGQNYFRSCNNATRGQIAKIDAQAAGYNETIPPTQQTYQDVTPSSTFWLYIERIALHGAISGYPGDGTIVNPCTGTVEQTGLLYFRWCNNATRGQTSKIVANTFFPGCDTPAKR